MKALSGNGDLVLRWECNAPWRDAFGVESDLSVAASGCVYGDDVEFYIAFDHDESLEEIGFHFGALENVRAVDFERLIRAEFRIEEL